MKYIYENNEIYVKKDDGDFLVHCTFSFFKKGIVNIDHTYVDPSLRGKGEASKLLHATMKYLKSRKLNVVASCPYAVKWLNKKEEYNDMIIKDKSISEGCKIIWNHF